MDPPGGRSRAVDEDEHFTLNVPNVGCESGQGAQYIGRIVPGRAEGD